MQIYIIRSIFFIFIFTMTITMKAWFRTIAAAFGAPAPAQTVAGILLLGLGWSSPLPSLFLVLTALVRSVLYTGYAIPKPSMIGALRWITYINVGDPSLRQSVFADKDFHELSVASKMGFRGCAVQRVPHPQRYM